MAIKKTSPLQNKFKAKMTARNYLNLHSSEWVNKFLLSGIGWLDVATCGEINSRNKLKILIYLQNE